MRVKIRTRVRVRSATASYEEHSLRFGARVDAIDPLVRVACGRAGLARVGVVGRQASEGSGETRHGVQSVAVPHHRARIRLRQRCRKEVRPRRWHVQRGAPECLQHATVVGGVGVRAREHAHPVAETVRGHDDHRARRRLRARHPSCAVAPRCANTALEEEGCVTPVARYPPKCEKRGPILETGSGS